MRLTNKTRVKQIVSKESSELSGVIVLVLLLLLLCSCCCCCCCWWRVMVVMLVAADGVRVVDRECGASYLSS